MGSWFSSPVSLKTFPSVELENLIMCAEDLEYFDAAENPENLLLLVADLKEKFDELGIHKPVNEPFFQRFAGDPTVDEVHAIQVLAGLCAVCCGSEPFDSEDGSQSKFQFLADLVALRDKERLSFADLKLLINSFVVGTCKLVRADCAEWTEDMVIEKTKECFEFAQEVLNLEGTLTLKDVKEWVELESDAMNFLDPEQRDSFDEPQELEENVTKRRAPGRRMTVCAEAVVADESWKPRVVGKDDAQVVKIRQANTLRFSSEDSIH